MNFNDLPLIPREIFFNNPERAAVSISPDGSQLMWLAPLNGVLNIWVAARDDLDSARPLTRDKDRGIHSAMWTYNSGFVLYSKDRDGDDNSHLYAVELATGKVRDLTPFDSVKAYFIARSQKQPDEIVAGLNQRNPKWYDIYRINIVNGERTLLLENERFRSVIVDNQLQLRMAIEAAADCSSKVYQLLEGEWQYWQEVPPEDLLNTTLIGFDESNESLYMRDSRGRNTSALVTVNVLTGQQRLLASDARVDVNSVLRHPLDKRIQAVSFVDDRRHWQVLDASIEADFTYLKNLTDGDFLVTSRSSDDRFWVVAFVVDDGPACYYLYDRQVSIASLLFTSREALQDLRLSKMHSNFIKARDDLDLLVYHSLPPGSESDVPGIPARPLPLVLIPHGGPWARDSWGFHPWHQWLANRGYAVLSVNFRGSIGFGKAFANAGNLEWGGKIIEDQQDAVDWAVRSGIADPARLAVLGGSFGGYSVLAGLAFTPKVFSCGIDLVGVANILTWMESIPDYWKPLLQLLHSRVGDPRTIEGRKLLEKHSPINYADQICRPLLVGQGANDPRVRSAEPEQIVKAMQDNGIPVIYALYPDEGHGFVRPQNRKSFFAMVEVFLAKHIGGRYESIGNDFDESSVQLITGAEHIPGLQEALTAAEKK